jgi:hypothetical protein
MDKYVFSLVTTVDEKLYFVMKYKSDILFRILLEHCTSDNLVRLDKIKTKCEKIITMFETSTWRDASMCVYSPDYFADLYIGVLVFNGQIYFASFEHNSKNYCFKIPFEMCDQPSLLDAFKKIHEISSNEIAKQ